MNERIKELMEQATSRPHRVQGFRGQPTYIYPGILDPEKFAELIVRECIETMKRTLDTECISENEKYGCMYAIVDVKDHFGVYDDGDLTITFRN